MDCPAPIFADAPISGVDNGSAVSNGSRHTLACVNDWVEVRESVVISRCRSLRTGELRLRRRKIMAWQVQAKDGSNRRGSRQRKGRINRVNHEGPGLACLSFFSIAITFWALRSIPQGRQMSEGRVESTIIRTYLCKPCAGTNVTCPRRAIQSVCARRRHWEQQFSCCQIAKIMDTQTSE